MGEPTIWSRLTPLNRALCLVLLVAVPFFLILLVAVIAYSLKTNDVKASFRSDTSNNYIWRAPKYRPLNRRRFYDRINENDDDDDDQPSYDYPEVDTISRLNRRRHSSREINDDYDRDFENKYIGYGNNAYVATPTSTDAPVQAKTNAPVQAETNAHVQAETNATISNRTETRQKRQTPVGDYYFETKETKYDDDCECDTKCGQTVKNPNIVAVNEMTFVDDPDDADFRYKCSGVIVSKSLILVSAECVTDPDRSNEHYQVKAGSEVWSSADASTHSVDRVIRSNDNNGLALLHLSVQLPQWASIKPADVGRKYSRSNSDNEMWYWDVSAIGGLQSRSKDSPMVTKPVSFTTCSECQNAQCVRQELTHVCSEYYYTSGNPVFANGKVVAMQTSYRCIDEYTAAQCYVSISDNVVNWIEDNA